jgi:hypothetical protein
VTTVKHQFHHARAGLAADLEIGKLRLGLLHGFLHLLRLAHQIANATFQHACISMLVRRYAPDLGVEGAV